MALYNETVHTFGPGGEHTFVEQYEQRRRWHLLHAVLSRLDRATWGLTMYGRPLDRLAERRHRRSCKDDCVTGEVWRRHTFDDVPPMPLDSPEAQEAWQKKYGATTVETYCGRNPLEVAISYRLYQIASRDRRTLARVPA